MVVVQQQITTVDQMKEQSKKTKRKQIHAGKVNAQSKAAGFHGEVEW